MTEPQEVIRIADTLRLRPMARIEADVIAAALHRYPRGSGGTIRAIRELQIGRSTFYRKIKQYGLKP
jgi:transcriptional regulator of acetoin/glycerol metabolism